MMKLVTRSIKENLGRADKSQEIADVERLITTSKILHWFIIYMNITY
jgi:hypothetical protein